MFKPHAHLKTTIKRSMKFQKDITRGWGPVKPVKTPQYCNTDCSKVVLLLWFLSVTSIVIHTVPKWYFYCGSSLLLVLAVHIYILSVNEKLLLLKFRYFENYKRNLDSYFTFRVSDQLQTLLE